MIPRLTVLLIAFALAGCWSDTRIQGSGHMQTQTVAVAPFTAVHIEAIANVFIEGGASSQSVSVTADEKFMPYLVSDVRDGTLTLSIKSGMRLAGNVPVYHIATASLRSFELDGSGKLQATKLSGDKLEVSVSGSGAFDLAGSVDALGVSINGSGRINAAELKVKRAKVVISGAGNVTINAADTLDVAISGAGNVRYIGSPKITRKISGSGNIIQQQPQ